MRIRRTLSLALAIIGAAGGLALTSTSSAAETGSAPLADSWINDGGGPNGAVPVELNDGRIVDLKTGTRFKMICWYHRITLKRFYGEITSGPYDGNYTNIQADAVEDQTVVPYCTDSRSTDPAAAQNTSVPGWAWLIYDDRAFGKSECERAMQIFKTDDPGSYRCVPASGWPGQWYVEKWTHFTG